jgi:hypothetical protein
VSGGKRAIDDPLLWGRQTGSNLKGMWTHNDQLVIPRPLPETSATRSATFSRRNELIDYRNLKRGWRDFAVLPTRKSDRHTRFPIDRCVRDPHGAVETIPLASFVERRLDMDHSTAAGSFVIVRSMF